MTMLAGRLREKKDFKQHTFKSCQFDDVDIDKLLQRVPIVMKTINFWCFIYKSDETENHENIYL